MIPTRKDINSPSSLICKLKVVSSVRVCCRRRLNKSRVRTLVPVMSKPLSLSRSSVWLCSGLKVRASSGDRGGARPARGADKLPVALIPEQRHVASVKGDVVNDRVRSHQAPALAEAHRGWSARWRSRAFCHL